MSLVHGLDEYQSGIARDWCPSMGQHHLIYTVFFMIPQRRSSHLRNIFWKVRSKPPIFFATDLKKSLSKNVKQVPELGRQSRQSNQKKKKKIQKIN